MSIVQGAAAVNNRICAVLGCIALWLHINYAGPPPQIPGEDISGTYNTIARISDTAVLAPPSASPHSPLWLETAMKTWDAPSLAQQIEEDATMVPVGKGAIYIPRFSDPALEPTVQINEPGGKLYKWGETGKKYTTLPGDYSVVLGSGSINQRIVKKITVEEGKVAPLIPDWCGLTVDAVDSNNIPFRGPYELARIDELEAYGRSYGRDYTLGERIKTWILKPGLYKIFTAGGGYNTLTNFITVRLIPGEFVRVIIIENQKDQIIGGGVVNTGALSARRKSNWNRNLNVGGTITFNSTINKTPPSSSSNVTNISFLTLFDLIYKKGSNDWETNVFWNEGLNFSDLNPSNINYPVDVFRLTSLWIWRVFFPWLGPYVRTQLQMEIFPVYKQFDKNDVNHYFIMLRPDSSVDEIDDITLSKRTKPAFSPVTFEAGIGANIDVVSQDNYDAKFRVGIGYSQTNQWSQIILQDSSSAIAYYKITSADTAQLDSALKRTHIILQQSEDMDLKSYGPEFGLALNLRAGNLGIARGDFKMIIPVDPLINKHMVIPNFDVNSTISWTLTRSVTLDYMFQYQLIRKIKQQIGVDVATHSLFLRFSFNSR
jgi:hypothetical protein